MRNPATIFAPRAPADRQFGGLRPIVDLVRLWHERSVSRRALAALDDRGLRDVGLEPPAARREAALWFWQDGGGCGRDR
ncbi:MAG: DUF1127 domain-containing protein [Geminicoccaceae bacterium]|nr:DUF1127 domain-containing protein [Geminicoccaceae bacterium]